MTVEVTRKEHYEVLIFGQRVVGYDWQGIFVAIMLRLFASILVCLSFASCTQKEPVETKEAMKRRLDSLSAERIRQIDERYQRDLHYRMKIEAIEKQDTTGKVTRASGNTNQ